MSATSIAVALFCYSVLITILLVVALAAYDDLARELRREQDW